MWLCSNKTPDLISSSRKIYGIIYVLQRWPDANAIDFEEMRFISSYLVYKNNDLMEAAIWVDVVRRQNYNKQKWQEKTWNKYQRWLIIEDLREETVLFNGNADYTPESFDRLVELLSLVLDLILPYIIVILWTSLCSSTRQSSHSGQCLYIVHLWISVVSSKDGTQQQSTVICRINK